MNIIAMCEKIGEKLPISAVRIRQLNSQMCEISVSIPDDTASEEETEKGVGMMVWERHPDIIHHELAEETEIKRQISALAKYGKAKDWACFAYGPGKKVYLTKPNLWFARLPERK